MVMCYLFEGLFFFFFLTPSTVNYIHPSAHLLVSVWGLEALSWTSSTDHAPDQMAVSRSQGNSLVHLCYGNVGLELTSWVTESRLLLSQATLSLEGNTLARR